MDKPVWVSQIKAVGFDLDGTLYHAPPAVWQFFKERLIEVVAEHVRKEPDEVREIYEERLRKLASNTQALNSLGLDGEQVFQTLFDSDEAVSFLRENVKRDERLVALLARLQKRYRLFIVSNGTERQIVRKLELLGLSKAMFAPFVACYDHDGWTKPNPAGFLYVLEQLGLEGAEALYVGDREGTDIAAAQGAGMRVCMVWGESEQADVSLPTVYDLGTVLL